MKKIIAKLLLIPLMVISITGHCKREAVYIDGMTYAYIHVENLNVLDVEKFIDSRNILPPKATITSDWRTNTLIIITYPKQFNDLRNFVKKLDVPIKESNEESEK